MTEAGYRESPVGRITEVGWNVEAPELTWINAGFFETHVQFKPPYLGLAPSRYNGIMTGVTSAATWDWRLIPRAPTGQRPLKRASAGTGIPYGLCNGPYYLETGNVVTPADRPCLAACAWVPTSGPYTDGVPEGRPFRLIQLNTFSASYAQLSLDIGGSHSTGSITVSLRATQFEEITETITGFYGATESGYEICVILANAINVGSSMCSATGVIAGPTSVPSPPGHCQITSNNWAMPAFPTSWSTTTGLLSTNSTNTFGGFTSPAFANNDKVTFAIPT